MSTENTIKNASAARLALIALLVAVAFFGAYKFAAARSASAAGTAAGSSQLAAGGQVAGDQTLVPAAGDPAAADAGSAGCSCCGSAEPTNNGVTGDPVEGVAQVSAGVQRISVDVSTVYAPNVIRLKAGVPAEVTFGQGGGCTAQVMSKDLGFFEDLSQGPRTIKIAALQPGEYGFSCGMEMVFGKFVVE